MADQKNQSKTDPLPGSGSPANSRPLARNLRVGLLGSPYDWGSLDFDAWNAQHVSLNLTAFAGSSQANTQDLLVSLKSDWSKTDIVCSVWQNDDSVLECEIGCSTLKQLTPESLDSIFERAMQQTNEQIMSQLKIHGDKYLSAESVIAKYGTQVLRVGTLLKNPQIHIENEALAYLIEAPWRNAAELEYVVSEMVFYLDGDILRKPYVQNFVYEFGTSLRGVSNSAGAQNVIQKFTEDVICKFDFRVASELFSTHLDSFTIGTEDPLFTQVKRAA